MSGGGGCLFEISKENQAEAKSSCSISCDCSVKWTMEPPLVPQVETNLLTERMCDRNQEPTVGCKPFLKCCSFSV